MPQLKINSGYSKSSITAVFFVITFTLLFLSGCASMMPIPEGPAEATLAVEQGRVLVSHGEVYEAAQDGMALEPDVRVIVLEGARAKVFYTVAQEGEETPFSCEVELEENSQLIVSGAQDCASGEITANNINVTAPEQAAVEFSEEEELTETNTIAASQESANNAEDIAKSETAGAEINGRNAESVAQSGSAMPATEPPVAANALSPGQRVQPVAAVKDIQLPETGKITPPAEAANVAAISPADDTAPPAKTEDLATLADEAIPKASVPMQQVALANKPESTMAAGGIQEPDAPLVRKTVVSTRTIELPEIDMQSIAAITKASDIPLVLQSLPQRIPGIKYIDAVIMPDNS